jgi:signal transduction histidine kinase
VIARRLLRSTFFRLARLYAGLSLATMLLTLGFIYWATAGYMDREFNATIDEEIFGLTEQYESRGLDGLSAAIAERLSLDANKDAVYLLTDGQFKPLAGNLEKWPADPVAATGWLRFQLPRPANARADAPMARARTFLLTGGQHLLVGREINDLEATRRLILDALGWGTLVTLVSALVIGFLMSTRVLRRIEAINQTSRDIMQGDLSRRIPTDESGDDYDQLAGNLNQMLDRIEALMESVRRVSDNIAHDLRTPLSRLRTRLEEIRSGQSEIPSQDIEQAIADADNLLVMFNALLRIARIESGSTAPDFTRLDMRELLQDITELYEPLAAEKQQQIVLRQQDSPPVNGDRDLLFQAFSNLVDNAIKHTPPGGEITLEVSASAGACKVQVMDTGSGIPPGLREKVFQRFYRCDYSRSTRGSGLGLSLVRAIIDIHHARIELADNAPGLRVIVDFEPVDGS